MSDDPKEFWARYWAGRLPAGKLPRANGGTSTPKFVRTAAVLEPIKARHPSIDTKRDAKRLAVTLERELRATKPKPLGIGVCSSCRESAPIFAKGKRALCRDCLREAA